MKYQVEPQMRLSAPKMKIALLRFDMVTLISPHVRVAGFERLRVCGYILFQGIMSGRIIRIGEISCQVASDSARHGGVKISDKG
jgi:hypothetical protein